MSTIRGQNLSITEEIDVAGKTGYDAIEPWMNKLNEFVASGGKIEELRKRIMDWGMTVENVIGFPKWLVDDPEERAKGLEEVKHDMDITARLGGLRIAAPPAGIPKGQAVSREQAAARYRAVLEVGDQTGVVPQIEMWAGNPSIGTVEQAISIALLAGHPKACFLGDVFHTYKSGSSFSSLLLLGRQALQHFHVNDYPANPPRLETKDSDRVFPGDGIAPLAEIFRNFRAVGANPTLSLELFNPVYWKLSADECAKTGLEKMKAAMASAD